jgi:broad specificity phosphatase PhoE
MANSEQAYTHRITLLRHGESTGNAQGVYQGRAEYDLSEKGRRQVKALADYWQALEITFLKIISSPLARAWQSAEIIGEILNIPLELDDNWQEIDNGNLAGLTLEEAEEKAQFPGLITPYDPIGGTGESDWDLYMRAAFVVQDLINRLPGDYLVVSHGGFLNRVMFVMLGITPQLNFSGARFLFRNTSSAVLEYNPSQHVWRLDQFNANQQRLDN